MSRAELIKDVEGKVKEGLRCGFCDASKRADVFSNPDFDTKESLVVIVKCKVCDHENYLYFSK